jgi:hypothetical protein
VERGLEILRGVGQVEELAKAVGVAGRVALRGGDVQKARAALVEMETLSSVDCAVEVIRIRDKLINELAEVG